MLMLLQIKLSMNEILSNMIYATHNYINDKAAESAFLYELLTFSKIWLLSLYFSRLMRWDHSMQQRHRGDPVDDLSWVQNSTFIRTVNQKFHLCYNKLLGKITKRGLLVIWYKYLKRKIDGGQLEKLMNICQPLHQYFVNSNNISF